MNVRLQYIALKPLPCYKLFNVAVLASENAFYISQQGILKKNIDVKVLSPTKQAVLIVANDDGNVGFIRLDEHLEGTPEKGILQRPLIPSTPHADIRALENFGCQEMGRHQGFAVKIDDHWYQTHFREDCGYYLPDPDIICKFVANKASAKDIQRASQSADSSDALDEKLRADQNITHNLRQELCTVEILLGKIRSALTPSNGETPEEQRDLIRNLLDDHEIKD